MARKTSEELQDLMKRENVNRIWSWSRFNTFHNSPYEYYLKYIKKVKEDRADSIYCSTGGIAHNILEKFYLNKISYDDMIDEFNEGWTMAFDIAELKFNRTDEERNKEISENYYKDLLHFFKNHNALKGRVMIEQFVKVKIGGNLFQGFIDVAMRDEDGNIHILDWKTSSVYLGKKAQNESGQLILYAIGLNQAGIPMDKIRIGWNFLKYVNVFCYKPKSVKLSWTTVKDEEKIKEKLDEDKIGSTLKASIKAHLKKLEYSKEETEKYLDKLVETNDIQCLPLDIQKLIHIEYLDIENKPRRIERYKIGESLQADCKKQMKKLGYNEEQIGGYLELLLQTNSIECLPNDIKEKYQIEDCYVEVPITQELIDKWTDTITTTIKDIELREKDYEETGSDKVFFDSEESIKEQSFYFANLCGYSPALHLPYQNYISRLEQMQREKDNLFSNVGNDNDVEIGSNVEDDYSWLNELM